MVAGASQLQCFKWIAVPTAGHELDFCKAFDSPCNTFEKKVNNCVRRRTVHHKRIDQYNHRGRYFKAPVNQWGCTTSSCLANLFSRLLQVCQAPTNPSAISDSSKASASPFPPVSSPKSSSPTNVRSSHGSTSPLFSAAWLSACSTSAIRSERLALVCLRWSL